MPSGESCPGWQAIDNNPRTAAIAAGDPATMGSNDPVYQLHSDPLYQLHDDGWIWRYLGQECAGGKCRNRAWTAPSARVCLSCHDSGDAFGHAALMTWQRMPTT